MQNKQTRLLVSALLASCLQVKSVLVSDAYQRVSTTIAIPCTKVSASHVTASNFAHDVISAELTDTSLGLLIFDTAKPTIELVFSSTLHVYLENVVQLLTVSVIPSVRLHCMFHSASSGVGISTVVGPMAVYLNQTSTLVLANVIQIVSPRTIALPLETEFTPTTDPNVSRMRILVVNETGINIWFRQEGTYENLKLLADENMAYSWLTLATSPYYHLQFALEEFEIASDEKAVPSEPRWSDPCRIKDNAVTGRYFRKFGFLWICVELNGLQTLVTLRGSLVFRNYCDFPAQMKLNDENRCFESGKRGTKLDFAQLSTEMSHSNCIISQCESCTLRTQHGSDNACYVTQKNIAQACFSMNDKSWSKGLQMENLPAEFDLVKARKVDGNDEINSNSHLQREFVTFKSSGEGALPRYAWTEARRAECKTVLPNDFDPLRPYVARRYTWIEVSLWPALATENSTEAQLSFTFTPMVSTKCRSILKSIV